MPTGWTPSALMLQRERLSALLPLGHPVLSALTC